MLPNRIFLDFFYPRFLASYLKKLYICRAIKKERKINMEVHEINTWLILGTLFLLCLVGLGIGIYDTMKQKNEKSLSA